MAYSLRKVSKCSPLRGSPPRERLKRKRARFNRALFLLSFCLIRYQGTIFRNPFFFLLLDSFLGSDLESEFAFGSCD